MTLWIAALNVIPLMAAGRTAYGYLVGLVLIWGPNRRRKIMADENNSGQFGNREDTEEQARKGGEASFGSSGIFGEENSADPSEAGRKGADAQPTEAKARGGENSH